MQGPLHSRDRIWYSAVNTMLPFRNISLFPAIQTKEEDEVLEEIIPSPLPYGEVFEESRLLSQQQETAPEDGSEWQTRALDGQLTVDVYETDAAIVIVAPIAGVRPEDFDITVVNDLVTIRGVRTRHHPDSTRLIVAECHWGAFSRSLILPAEVRTDRVKALLKQGVLTVILPKLQKESRVSVQEVDL